MGIRHRIVIIVRMQTSTATTSTSSTLERTPCRHCEGLSQGKAERCHFCGRWLLKVAELVS